MDSPVMQPGYVARLRDSMLNDVILALAIISAPMVILSISRASAIGWRPVFGFQVLAVSFIWVFWGLRSHISYSWRVGILLFLLATIGLGGYADMGPAAVAGQFLLLFLVVAALFMRAKPAFYSGVAITSLLALVATRGVQGKLGVGFDYASYTNDPATWAVLFLAVAGFGGAIAMMAARLISEVETHDDMLAKTVEDLRLNRDAAESANRLKGEILMNLGHEFRTPMNGIIGMAELLHLTDENPERQGYIRELQISANRLRSMLERILDYVRLGDGKVTLEDSPFDLCELATQAIKRIQETAGSKGIDVKFSLEQTEALLAIGDGWRLKQVLDELLANAVSFTDAGVITLHLRQVPAAGDERLLIEFEITDTGAGIPPDRLESVFEPFVQVDGSVTRDVGGSGLGLAISQRIVRLMDGEISLSSTVGAGTTVTFHLPFRR